jgi:ABC-type uncharacterized transport system fused permease/ATPase subunit
VRENAESVAFYGGDQREAELAGARLARVIATIFGKVRLALQLSIGSLAICQVFVRLPPLWGWGGGARQILTARGSQGRSMPAGQRRQQVGSHPGSATTRCCS